MLYLAMDIRRYGEREREMERVTPGFMADLVTPMLIAVLNDMSLCVAIGKSPRIAHWYWWRSRHLTLLLSWLFRCGWWWLTWAIFSELIRGNSLSRPGTNAPRRLYNHVRAYKQQSNATPLARSVYRDVSYGAKSRLMFRNWAANLCRCDHGMQL